MKIKICGLSRDEDIAYVNEAHADYAGFVFAQSRRQVSPALAARLRRRLDESIVPAGVFVNEPVENIAALYRDGIIGIAQLHGGEDEEYIMRLKAASASDGLAPIPVIKVIMGKEMEKAAPFVTGADYCLFDSGRGSGRTFNWNLLDPKKMTKPWFLAGGITIENIEQAMALNPFAIDISGGAETDGVKNREKIVQLTAMVRKGNFHE